MAEYISKKSFIERVKDIPFWGSVAVLIAEQLPAADVREVVFCKDCVYSDNWYADRLMCYLWNEHDGNSVFEDGFCNYGRGGKRVRWK